MIRDVEKWERWQREYARSIPLNVERNFRIFQALYDHARALGVVPRKDPLEGIEFKIRLAKDLRSVYHPSRNNRDGT